MTTESESIKAMLASAKPPVIIKHAGTVNSAISDGQTVFRRKMIKIKGIGSVKTAPYDNHFVYYQSKRIGNVLYCTCGSPAVVVGYDVYKNNASQQGAMLVCLHHATTGKHMDGSQ